MYPRIYTYTLNQRLRPIFIAFIVLAITQGCTVTNIQQVEVNAPPIQQSVRISDQPDPGAFYARGYVSRNNEGPQETQIAGHTDVNNRGVFEVEPLNESNRYLEYEGVNVQRFRGDNFTWNVPQTQGGIDLEWHATPFLALVGGLGVAELDGRTQISQNAGLGLLFGSETVAARLDFGIHFYESRYSIIAVQGHETSFGGDRTRVIDIFELEKKDDYNNASLGLTLNSRHTDRRVNYFFNYTLGRQTFYDVRDEFFFLESGQQQHFEYRYSENYNAFAAGMFVRVNSSDRFVFGARWTKYNDEMDQVAFFNVFLQYDVRLF